MASKFDTNASYLSKVVNHYKQTSFSNYINQLRIEYCIEQLKNNKLWRKYTIKAIANEVGFNKAESFSKAFYKYTELRPSYFIKELKKKAPSSF
ncbi:helix-turn-helix domain-containing protein [Tenacibaculum xiamenense]|uniref:helix-turn-helix domain-containing protein n=1 Tax=Tenacibaculum xiamenense TaxID=1261553 RepID=UPI003894F171